MDGERVLLPIKWVNIYQRWAKNLYHTDFISSNTGFQIVIYFRFINNLIVHMNTYVLISLLLLSLVSSQSQNFYHLQLNQVNQNQISNQVVLTQDQLTMLLNNSPSIFFKLKQVIVRVPAPSPPSENNNQPQSTQNNENFNQLQINTEEPSGSQQGQERSPQQPQPSQQPQPQQNKEVQPQAEKPEQSSENQNSQMEVTSDPGLSADLGTQRKYLLYLINKLRKQNGAGPLKLDRKLNILSQNHSRDMIQRKFFDHRNPDNEGPGDRAKAMGINGRIAENIAISSSLTQADKQLENSPGHFRNSVNPIYETVGFGVAIDERGRVFLTVMFSTRNFETDPIKKEELEALEKQLVKIVIQRNPNIVAENKEITKNLKVWQSTNRAENLFSFLRRSGDTSRFLSMARYYSSYNNKLVQSFISNNVFVGVDPRFTHVSLSLAVLDNRVEYLAIFSA